MISLQVTSHAVTQYFEGTLQQNLSQYPAGTTFNGSFSYEYPQTAYELDLTFGSYSRFNANSISVSFGSENINFIKDPNIGPYGIFMNEAVFQVGISGEAFLGNWQVTFIVIALNSLGSPFPVQGELPVELNLDLFEYKDIGFYGVDSSQNNIIATGTITSLVPEPSALSLLAVGLSGLALVRRRRS